MAKIETTLSDAQVRIMEALVAGTYEVTIGKRAGTPTTIPLPMADFPANAWQAIVRYGAQRKFNDEVGGSDTDVAAKVAAVKEMVEEYKRGEVGRTPGVRVTPIESAVRNIVRKLYVPKLDEAGKKAWDKMEAPERNAQLDAVFAKQKPEAQAMITAKAQAAVDAAIAEAKANAELAKELGGLSL